MAMKWLLLAGAGVLASCGHDGVKVKIQKVYIEKPVPCVEEGQLPAKPAPLAPRPENVSAALDLAVAKLVELLGPKLDGKAGYVGKVDVILNGVCKEVKD